MHEVYDDRPEWKITTYLDMLDRSYAKVREIDECSTLTKLAYLAEYIFDFTTYDDRMARLFAQKAVEVCRAINDGETYEYVEDEENHKWYLVMCNMPFFASKIEWGTSVRGAWWIGEDIKFSSDGIYTAGGEQVTGTIEFTTSAWKLFIAAIVEFAKGGKA